MRNSVIFEHMQWEATTVIAMALSVSFDDLKANTVFMGTGPSSSASLNWLLPPVGALKFKVDGSVWQTREAGCGGVLRDCDRNWVQGFCRLLSSSNPLLAELWAIRTAVDIVVQRAHPHVIIETDSVEVHVVVTSTGSLISPYCETVLHIRRCIPHGMKVTFDLIPREANMVADCLAKNAHVFNFEVHHPLVECCNLDPNNIPLHLVWCEF